MPGISVIVPVYKVEPYLRRCVDSILAQTFTDFELILVDDGSPDNCGAICDAYAKQDKRIRVIHKENGGPSSARNVGIQEAKGRYLMFCDSDDYVHPQWCEIMLDAIAQHPHAMVVSDVFCVYNGTVEMDESRNTGEIEIENSYFSLYKKGISAYTINKIYDVEIIRNNRFAFMEDCRFSEDVAFNVAYCRCCLEIVYVRKQLYYYIQNAESLMNRYYSDLFSLHLLPFQCRLPLIEENELGEYCDIWLYQFQRLFKNVFDRRNHMSFIQKMQYNHRMMNTDEFRYCLEHAAGEKETALSLKVLKKHNYYLYWSFNKLVQLKQRLRRKHL